MSDFKYIGQPIARIEDDAFIRGAGTYVDDIHLPGMLEAAFVRSSFAHAKIRSIDVAAARAAPGVHAVYTFDDIRPSLTQDRLLLELRLEKLPPNITPFPLAKDEVVFVGEAIAVVIADSRYLAEDAAMLVEVDYEPLPAVADCVRSVQPGAPAVDTRQASNVVKEFRQAYGDVETAFAAAPHRAKLKFKTHRGAAHPIEGRAVLAHFDRIDDRLTVWDSTQESHDVRGLLVELLGLNEHQIRVIAPDVGGGFGTKHLMYPEEVVISVVSRMLERPVKWIEDRREHFLASTQERDQYWDMEIAFSDEGKLLGMRGHMIHDHGAYTPRGTNLPTNTSTAVPGPYMLPCLDLRITVALTNKVSTIPIRGAGYPAANFTMERSLDWIARTLKMDRAEVRRRNLIPPEKMPYDTHLAARSGSAIIYDSGDYPRMMQTVLDGIGYADFPERQRRAREQGKLLGVGMAMGLKGTGRGPFESATVRVDRTGKVMVFSGAVGIGQGVKTALAQICSEQLGIDPSEIKVVTGDTGAIASGLGAFASRQTIMGGSAVHVAAVEVRRKLLAVAAELLEASADDIELKDGRACVKGIGDLSVSFKDIGQAMIGVSGYKLPGNLPPGLEHSHNFQGTSLTYGGAALAAEVEVDAVTGHIVLRKIVVANDAGRVINPQTVRGQVIGAIVHSLGNTLFEWMGYDDQAQPVTTTFAEYLMPTAPEIPRIDVKLLEFLGTNNPLGIKGSGETASIPVPGAVISAVEHALQSTGMWISEFPLSPARLSELVDLAAAEPVH